MVVLSVLIATRASWFHNGMEARQLSGTDDDAQSSPADESSSSPTPTDTPTPTDSSSSSSSTTSSTTTSSSAPPSSSDPPPTTTPTSSSSSSPPSSSQSSPTTTPSSTGAGSTTPPPTSTPSSSAPPTTSEGSSSHETSDSTESSSTKPTPVTKTHTVYYTTTDSGGQTHVGSSEAVVVSTPGFSGGDGSKNSNSGLSATARNTIIGVTVGVGGAIILAAAGILYWRLRNKRRSQEENEELISYGAGFGGPGTAEKSEPSGTSAGARSPFQSTLETYHAPTQTNAASNF